MWQPPSPTHGSFLAPSVQVYLLCMLPWHCRTSGMVNLSDATLTNQNSIQKESLSRLLTVLGAAVRAAPESLLRDCNKKR